MNIIKFLRHEEELFRVRSIYLMVFCIGMIMPVIGYGWISGIVIGHLGFWGGIYAINRVKKKHRAEVKR